MSRLIHESAARRLAFIRYLYGEAVRQAEQPEPMCVASVLTFHDAAETFLVLACEHLDVGKKSMTFLAYWEELSRKLPDDGLTQKKAMSRLNEARVGLKHHGNMPARTAVQEYRYITTLFFEENTPTVFGVEFGNLSMAYLVRHPLLRADLEEAEELHGKGDVEGAVGKVAVAFYRLLDSRKKRNSPLSELRWPVRSPSPAGYSYGGPPINFRPQKGEADKDGYARKKIGEILEQTDALKKAVEPMQDAMVALSLDLDYGRYRRFLELTPPVAMMLPKDGVATSDLYVPTPLWHHERPRQITSDSYRYCFNFVVEAAVRENADPLSAIRP